ncbi:carbon-nitrogen hydrolase family protein [Methylovirgula sp. 4M-Z18]|uniref:carbon-nitrogen hydrolase family protein n=2 Tax=Methylovirgula sp. 4M-Z18 TaxID=2293567 RepID=UPI000E2FAE9D|nr:carbon-nitrogen hydrolase family protein [Methylovirgula sp. 4M-Z18]RFB79553.1 carbon-nitrogen hydrolase family protein [Methylovirgula sp. 4M-Z18]
MVPFAVAGVQMSVPSGQDNTAAVVETLAGVTAHFPWVQMVVFSELACCGPLPTNPVSLPGPEEDRLCEAARRAGVWLVPGSIFERGADGALYNTCPVIDPNGFVVARYRKMFPFRPYERDVVGGTDFCVFDVPKIGRFGLSICYDIWFPETTRQLAAMGAEVLLHPVLTPTIDRDVELAIARATAVQNQLYVIDINGLGAGGIGRSAIFDPAGAVVYQAGGQREILATELNLELVRRQREFGLHGLGQPLKSFRDRPTDFPVYNRQSGADAYLHTLGLLEMPQRGSMAGLNVPLYNQNIAEQQSDTLQFQWRVPPLAIE